MKFYNPFKWHIFKAFDDRYYVRRRGILFNYYVDLKDGYHWSDATESWTKYCVGTYAQAKEAHALAVGGSFVE